MIEIPRGNGGTGTSGRPDMNGDPAVASTSPTAGDFGSTSGSLTDTQRAAASTTASDQSAVDPNQRQTFKQNADSSAPDSAAASEVWQPSSTLERGGPRDGTVSTSGSPNGGAPGGPGGEPPDPFAPNSPSGLFAQQESRVDPRAPQWGARTPGSSIGLEREVIIRIDDSEVAVARELPITITSGMTRDELQSALAETLDAHIRAWGLPPKSFYWMPVVRYQILPGGNQYLKRLTEVTDEWSVKSHTEYVFE